LQHVGDPRKVLLDEHADWIGEAVPRQSARCVKPPVRVV
jgi:hypothetical protein